MLKYFEGKETTAPNLLFYGSIIAISAVWFDAALTGLIHNHGIIEIMALITIYVLTEAISTRHSFKVKEDIQAEIVKNNKETISAINSTLDQTISAIKNTLDFRYVGDHSEALEYVASRAKNAKRVKDTYLRGSQDEILPGYPERILTRAANR